ncbi:MAG: DUF1592 domain-containing protein [Archangiaceae bacterium]|nr:DUF1592 domain-containing protein [Archangiaceae bacterium]
MRWSAIALAFSTVACLQPTPPPPLTLGETPSPSEPSAVVTKAPLRRLTRAQYHQSAIDLFDAYGFTDTPAWRFPGEETAGPFLTQVKGGITPLEVDVAVLAADELATRAAAQPEKLLSCVDQTLSCVQEAVATLAARAYRHPLTGEERADLGALAQAGFDGGGGAKGALRLALTGVLASPSFLSLVERGRTDAPTRLTGYEVAARLALLLRGGLPDEALTQAAADGTLDTADGIAAQTWRLLKEPRARTQLAVFHQQWLGLGGLAHLDKDTRRYPWFDDTARAAMRDELEGFVDAVIRRSDGRLETLFSSPFAFVRAPLHKVYGVTAVAAGESVGLDPEERAGLLTQAAFLATHASPKLTSPTHRGLVLLRNVMCFPLGDPPPGVKIDPIPTGTPGQTTRRALVEQHSQNPACRSCHAMMDPLGLSFERYDAAGVYRAVDLDDGAPIDSTATIDLGDPALDGPVKDAVELSKRLGRSENVLGCTATQWYRFAFGRLEGPDDTAELQALAKRFVSTRGQVPDLIVALTTSDAFRSRAP